MIGGITCVIFCKDGIIRFKRVEHNAERFAFNGGTYHVRDDRLYKLGWKRYLVYAEGCPEPLDFRMKDYGITAEDIHQFSNRTLINAIVTALNSTDWYLIAFIVLILLNIVNIAVVVL